MPLQISNHSDAILHGITFEVASGSHLCILGANGAGKTTLAKILCGLTPSDAVTVDGKVVHTLHGSERTKRVNYIPAKLEIFDRYMPVEELLALSHFDRSLSIETVLESVGIAHLRHHPCHTLSSGESQLVLTASALLHGADYTLFDEPTANLDPLRMRTLFALLSDDDVLKSKIVITHNLELAFKLGFDILYLEEGRILFQGSADAFFAQSQLDAIYRGSVQNLGSHVVVVFDEKVADSG